MSVKKYRSQYLSGGLVVLSLLISGCGGGSGSSVNSPAPTQALALTVVSKAVVVDDAFLGVVTSGTLCENQACTLQINADQPITSAANIDVAAFGGAAPYGYKWMRVSGNRAAIDSMTSANPKFTSAVNWGDDFTEVWQVTATDAANTAVSRNVNVNFTALAQDNVSAQTVAVSIKGTVTDYTVPTALITGVTSYPTQVYVPPDYATTTDNLPVIYITDGPPYSQYNGWQFTDVCRILEEQHVRAIVVGITGQNRDTDYPMDGAASFYSFVTTEELPFVESRYRIDATKRTLSGHSAGGLFVGLALMMDRPGHHYFANFVAMDGAFWYKADQTVTMENDLFTAYGGQLPGVRLILSSSTGGLSQAVQDFHDHLKSLGFTGLNITLVPPYQTQHLLMFDEAFAASLKLLFP